VSGSTIKKKDKTLLAREIELAKKMVYSKGKTCHSQMHLIIFSVSFCLAQN